ERAGKHCPLAGSNTSEAGACSAREGNIRVPVSHALPYGVTRAPIGCHATTSFPRRGTSGTLVVERGFLTKNPQFLSSLPTFERPTAHRQPPRDRSIADLN